MPTHLELSHQFQGNLFFDLTNCPAHSQASVAVALGAIGGAVSEGLVTGLSIGGQTLATAVTGATQWGAQAAAQGAKLISRQFGQFAVRSALISGVSSVGGSAASTGMTSAVSRGLQSLDPGALALSIFAAAGMGLLKGIGTGAASAAWSGKLEGIWSRLPRVKYPIAGAGGLALVGGSYVYFYNRES